MWLYLQRLSFGLFHRVDSSRRPFWELFPRFWGQSRLSDLWGGSNTLELHVVCAAGIPSTCGCWGWAFSTLWNTALPIVMYTRSAFTGNLSQFVSSLVVFILTFIVPQTCLWCLWSCSYKAFSLVLLKLLAVSSAFRLVFPLTDLFWSVFFIFLLGGGGLYDETIWFTVKVLSTDRWAHIP